MAPAGASPQPKMRKLTCPRPIPNRRPGRKVAKTTMFERKKRPFTRRTDIVKPCLSHKPWHRYPTTQANVVARTSRKDSSHGFRVGDFLLYRQRNRLVLSRIYWRAWSKEHCVLHLQSLHPRLNMSLLPLGGSDY